MQLISGTELRSEGVTVRGMVPPGHKVATKAIARRCTGAPLQPDHRFCQQTNRSGEHVHVNNLAMGDFERDYAFGVDVRPVAAASPQATFMGIKRAMAAWRHATYIGLLSTVNCSATVCKLIADHFRPGPNSPLNAFPNVTASWRSRIRSAAAWMCMVKA